MDFAEQTYLYPRGRLRELDAVARARLVAARLAVADRLRAAYRSGQCDFLNVIDACAARC